MPELNEQEAMIPARQMIGRPSKVALRRILSVLLAAAIFIQPILASAQRRGPRLIRDSEIESLVRDYAKPIFRAAHVNSSAVNIYVINNRAFNAFVADGRRMFINAGALMQSETPNEIIGVIAHETGHIEGGHLARLREQLATAQIASIITMLLGVGAMAAGAAAGSRNAGSAGSAIITGGQSAIQRTMLAYQRTEEQAADRAAVRYLAATGQSVKGMIKTFRRFADQALVSLRFVDPYLLSHPMPRVRLSALDGLSRNSRYYNRKDPAKLQLRHDLMRAKLFGFLERPAAVLRRYPLSDKSLPARYARAIKDYLSSDLRVSQRSIDALIKSRPKNPYFWELKGQSLLESGRGAQAIAPLRKAVALAPNAGLIRMLYGQALLATEKPRHLNAAITQLKKALRKEPNGVVGWRQLAIAYGRRGDIPRAEMASARAYFSGGDLTLAKHHATRVQKKTRKGTPLWLQADDIINFKPKG